MAEGMTAAMTIASPDSQSFDAAGRLLEEHATIDAAYVLGSAVSGRLRPDSDIDIAILLRPAAALSVADRMGPAFDSLTHLDALTSSWT
jgi:predicted nucleotidyltransferase